MSLIREYPELAVAISAATFSAVGYLLHAWRGRRENLREALYLLIEIWHRSTIISLTPVNQLFDLIIDRMRALMPETPITADEASAMRAYFTPILQKTARLHAIEGIEGLHDAYGRVVQLISRSDPILAYDLDSASTTKRKLASMDRYFDDALQPLIQGKSISMDFAESLRGALTSKAEADTTDQLEGHLLALARRIGPMTWLRTKWRVRKRRRMLRDPKFPELDKVITELIVSLMPALPQKAPPRTD